MNCYLRYIFCAFFISAAVFGSDTVLDRIETHFLLKDYYTALNEAKNELKKNPNSYGLNKAYLKALALHGREIESIKLLNNISSKTKSSNHLMDLKKDYDLIESIAWVNLKKGIDSDQYSTRLSSMLGIFYTKDYRAVDILLNMMDDSNAIIRSVAIDLASNYADQPIKDKISDLFDRERVWLVQLEIIKAIGKLKIKSKASNLIDILKDVKSTILEKNLAMQSLIKIYDEVDEADLDFLLNSPFSSLRKLGLELSLHFKVAGAEEKILTMVFDSNYDVRLMALKALLFHYKDLVDQKELREILLKAIEDKNAFVKITASYLGSILSIKKAKKSLYLATFDEFDEYRRYAAGAIAQSMKYNKDIANKIFVKSHDDFVKANLALGFLGLRIDVDEKASFIFDFIEKKRHKWMWDTSSNIFNLLAPSRISHTDQIPNYPEAVDQMTELNILSILAVLQHPQALEAVKLFLNKKSWGISGLAAITLLQEGDEHSIEILKKLLSDENKNIRLQAAIALATIGKDKSVLPILEKAYHGANHEKKLMILGAIGNLSDEKSIEFLLKALEDPFQIIKIAAASAIVQAINL